MNAPDEHFWLVLVELVAGLATSLTNGLAIKLDLGLVIEFSSELVRRIPVETPD